MSGFFGIFNRNGKPIEEKTVHTMLDAMSYWEPDERNTWIDGPVALGHAMLWNTPESKYEHLPLEKDAYVLNMDARIDNRDELLRELELPDRSLEEIGDSEFILAAYKKWGEECPKYLLGDFAFTIWDEKKRQLFCARDHIGIKPFYYHMNDEIFIYANDIRCLVAHPDISKNINDEAVAIYLTKGELWHPSITFFETIQKLPPATSLTVLEKSTDKKIYWEAEYSPKIRFNTLEEYSKKLRELLEDSVHKRLRTENPIASHLSGGLDSSVIATIAARYLRSQDKSLQAYNWVAEPKAEDDYEYYEWANSRRIAELENIEHHYIQFNAEMLGDLLLNHDISLNDTVDLWYEFVVRKEAKNDNVCTVLSGWGGDELITYHAGVYYADRLRNGHIISTIKELYEEARKNKKSLKRFIANLYYKLFVPFMPHWLHCFLPKIQCKSEDYLQYINPSFYQKMHNISIPNTIFTMNNMHKEQLELFHLGHLVNRIESWASSGFLERIEYGYPLLDKRVVEFALGIPTEMYRKEGKSRYLYRHAISGLLPEDMRWKHFKSERKRVDKLSFIIKEALKIWLEKVDNAHIDKSLNLYINYELLKEQVRLLDNMEQVSFEEESIIVDTIVKSILVSNIGH